MTAPVGRRISGPQYTRLLGAADGDAILQYVVTRRQPYNIVPVSPIGLPASCRVRSITRPDRYNLIMNGTALLIGLLLNAAAVLFVAVRLDGEGRLPALRDRKVFPVLMAGAACCYLVAFLSR